MRLFWLCYAAIFLLVMARQQFCHACGDGPFTKISNHYQYCAEAQDFPEVGFERNLRQDARREARRQARLRALRDEAREQREAHDRRKAERRARQEVCDGPCRSFVAHFLTEHRRYVLATQPSHPQAQVGQDVNAVRLRGLMTWCRLLPHNSPPTCLVSPNMFQSLLPNQNFTLCPSSHQNLPPATRSPRPCCRLTFKMPR